MNQFTRFQIIPYVSKIIQQVSLIVIKIQMLLSFYACSILCFQVRSFFLVTLKNWGLRIENFHLNCNIINTENLQIYMCSNLNFFEMHKLGSETKQIYFFIKKVYNKLYFYFWDDEMRGIISIWIF